MIALVHLARVAEVSVIKRILQNERNARDMDAAISFGHHARLLKKYRQAIECRFSVRISLKHLAHKRGVLFVDSDCFCARVVQVADRGESGIYPLPCFLS
ncbi:hypothetical protein A2680_02140 [Candidatus Kaiserbacteria bacterium RIFCSPHIGHO2_01_FULL_55_37]|nr:MAG: hypothetical protein A2680_02140 [Candidatus Kaiserbacteria bacterium RIFCSPHIGHO2_01_FULL_55_37]